MCIRGRSYPGSRPFFKFFIPEREPKQSVYGLQSVPRMIVMYTSVPMAPVVRSQLRQVRFLTAALRVEAKMHALCIYL